MLSMALGTALQPYLGQRNFLFQHPPGFSFFQEVDSATGFIFWKLLNKICLT